MSGVGDHVCDEASAAVRWSGQGDGAVVVVANRGVADGVHVARARSPAVVDEDVASPGLDAGRLGEGRVGADAGRQDDDVGAQLGAVGQGH